MMLSLMLGRFFKIVNVKQIGVKGAKPLNRVKTRIINYDIFNNVSWQFGTGLMVQNNISLRCINL